LVLSSCSAVSFYVKLDLRKIAHLSKPKQGEIKSLFSTGSVFVDTQIGEKGILAAWGGLGGVVGLRKSSKVMLLMEKKVEKSGIVPPEAENFSAKGDNEKEVDGSQEKDSAYIHHQVVRVLDIDKIDVSDLTKEKTNVLAFISEELAKKPIGSNMLPDSYMDKHNHLLKKSAKLEMPIVFDRTRFKEKENPQILGLLDSENLNILAKGLVAAGIAGYGAKETGLGDFLVKIGNNLDRIKDKDVDRRKFIEGMGLFMAGLYGVGKASHKIAERKDNFDAGKQLKEMITGIIYAVKINEYANRIDENIGTTTVVEGQYPDIEKILNTPLSDLKKTVLELKPIIAKLIKGDKDFAESMDSLTLHWPQEDGSLSIEFYHSEWLTEFIKENNNGETVNNEDNNYESIA